METRETKPREAERTTGGAAPASPASGLGALGLYVGWMLCAGGLVSAVVGVFSEDVPLEAVGIVAGIVGYIFGARTLGTVTIVVSTVLMLVVLMVVMGEIPGIGPMG